MCAVLLDCLSLLVKNVKNYSISTFLNCLQFLFALVWPVFFSYDISKLYRKKNYKIFLESHGYHLKTFTSTAGGAHLMCLEPFFKVHGMTGVSTGQAGCHVALHWAPAIRAQVAAVPQLASLAHAPALLDGILTI